MGSVAENKAGGSEIFVFPVEVAHVADRVAVRQEAVHMDGPKLWPRGRWACEVADRAPFRPSLARAHPKLLAVRQRVS